MNSRDSSIIYGILGIYAVLISWYYNHSILLAIFHYLIWPVYLLWELLNGRLAHDMWKIIPQSYFK